MTFRAPLFHKIFSLPKATGDPARTLNPLLTPNPARPFIQTDWPRATDLTKLKTVGEPIGRVMPLLTPNPAQPFAEYDWPAAARTPLSLKSDSYWGGSPLFYPNPAQPFRQNLWEGEKPLPKALGEALGGDSPLLTPNPPQPFVQNDWLRAPLVQKAKVDDFVNIPAPPVVVVQPPFFQNLWENPKGLPKAVGEALGGDASLLTPNPAQPFNQSDWLCAPSPQKAKVDDVVNLLPVQSVVVVVSPPFIQSDWPLTATLRAKASDSSLAPDLSLYFPNPPQPFLQDDWPKPNPVVLSDRGFGFGLNPNLPPPIPPPPTGLHARPFLATIGMLTHLPGGQ